MKIRILPYTVWFISALFYMYEFIHRISISVMTKELIEEFSSNSYDIGNISAFYFFSYAIFQIPAGLIIDKFGVKTIYKAAILVGLGCFLFSQSLDIFHIKVARVIIGVGSAFSFITCLKIILSHFKNKNNITVLIGATNFLGVIGALIGGAPLANLINNLGWRYSMVFLSIISFFFAILLYFSTYNLESKKQKVDFTFYKNSLIALIKSKQIWLISIFGSLMLSPIIILSELWGTQYLMIKYNLNKEIGAFLSSLTFLGVGIGGIFNGYFAYRIKKNKPILLFGNIGSFFCVLSIIYVNFSIPILILLHFLFGFFSSAMLLCFSISIKHFSNGLHGTIIGFLNTVITIGSVFFQPLTGYLLNNNFQELHFKYVFVILPICLIISFVIQYFIEEDNNLYYDKSSS